MNLDLNEVLRERPEGQFEFPVIKWIEKLGLLHRDPPTLDWSLCLTLHGETPWNTQLASSIAQFLNDNFSTEPEFEEMCRDFVGGEIVNEIKDLKFNPAARSILDQQRILCATVPKLIANSLRTQGWEIITEYNLIYGGTNQRAPMYSCVMSFKANESAARAPSENYRASLRSILSKAGQIDSSGELRFHYE